MTKSNSNIERKALALFEQSFELPSDQRRAWLIKQTKSSPDIQKRVLSFFDAERQDLNRMQTGSVASEIGVDAKVPAHIGAYAIRELIGQGGMGAVYRAERDKGDFDHVVAVKIIKPGLLSDKLEPRFQNEQQILAGFNHPNIARLYDGGKTEDGSPYIIMEYIEGAPITDWAKDNHLSLEDRLKLFKTTCLAVNYAHQNQIIHRDLTPSNMLVTTGGQVKLIDFGIAKPHAGEVEDSHPPNSLASLSFTPGFAAPERSQGAAANTLTDIYSLGKLLEALTKPLSPSEDLRAIIVKAVQKDPKDRYTSVDALREDITNYTDGFTVKAHPQSLAYSGRKFISRNRGPVLTSCLALMGLIGALGITTHLYQQAETARATADKRFNEARDMANYMLFDLYDELQPISGNTKALQDMADRSKSYLDDLSKSSRANNELELETIQGYHRLANIEGNPVTSNLGRRDKARQILDIAEQRLDALALAEPTDIEVLREQGKLKFSQAVFAYIADDDNEASIKYAQDGLKALDQLISKDRSNMSDLSLRLEVFMYTGKPYIWLDQSAKAVEVYQQIEKEYLALEADNPNSEEVEYGVASFYTSFTEVLSWHIYLVEDKPDAMLRVADESVRRTDILRAKTDTQTDYRRASAIAYYRRALALGDLSWFEKTIPDLRAAREISQSLVADDPENASSLSLLGAINSQLMIDLSSIGEFSEAEKIGKTLIERVRKQHIADPENPGYWRTYFQKLQMVGEVFFEAKEYKKACEYFLESAQSAKSFDQEIGMGETDRAHMYADLLKQDKACKEGRISQLKLEE